MNQAIRWAGESESRLPIDYRKLDLTPVALAVKIKRGPGKGRTRIVVVTPSRTLALERAARRFRVNIKKRDGAVSRALLEDVIGRKPGMYRKKVSQ